MTLRILNMIVCIVACTALGACTTVDEKRKVDYKNARALPPLEVPPDLTALPETNSPVASAPAAATFSNFATDRGPAPVATEAQTAVLPRIANARIERDSQMRWLVVQASPEALWPRVREFILNTGLIVERENPAAGILETDWRENRPRVGSAGQLFVTRWLGTLFSTGMRDRFRIRLERGFQPGTTEIYVAHQGMEEIVVGAGPDKDAGGSKWQPRATDPDLEIELMRQLMVALGQTEEQAAAVVAQAPAAPPERAQLARRGDSFMLQLDDSLDRAWRRVGLSLDRVGFTVEDRDRSKGVYYVRYLDPDKGTSEPGWFSRLFGAEEKKPEERYQIQLQSADAGTHVIVRNQDGATEFGTTSERILSLLYQQLK
jgi:outer membrane protein assembly factor BamC